MRSGTVLVRTVGCEDLGVRVAGVSAIAASARAAWRGRARAQIALALLVALSGGVSIAALAASRRVDSSFDRLKEAAGSPDVEIEFDDPPDLSVVRDISELAGVRSVTLSAFVAVGPESGGMLPFRDTIAFSEVISYGTSGIDGLIEEGRGLGDNPAEVLLNRAMADLVGAEVGDELPLVSLTPEAALAMVEGEGVTEPDGPSVTATVVGITKAVEDVSDAPDPYLLVPTSFAETYNVGSFPLVAGVRVADARVGDVIDGIEPLVEGEVRPTSDFGRRISDGIGVQSVGLLALALAVGVAGAVAIVQAVGRTAALYRDEDQVRAALGMTPTQRRVLSVARVFPGLVVGVGGAVAVAITGGPSAISGLAHQAEPDPGPWLDLPVLALGVVAVSVLGCGAAVIAANRSARRARREPSADSLDRIVFESPLPLTAALGVRRAIGRQSARWSGRSALAAVAAAFGVVVAVLTFTHSVDGLFASPAQWGANYDGFVVPATSDEGFAAGVADLRADPDVAAATIVSESSATLRTPDGNEITTSIATTEQVKAHLEPWVVIDGQTLQNADEAIVGARVLDDMDLEVGDVLPLETDGGAHELLIVGEVVLYGIDEIDDGIVVTGETAERLSAGNQDPGIVVRFRPGVDVDAALAAMSERYEDVGGLEPPSSIDNLDELGLLPTVLAVLVAGLGVVAGAQALGASLSRSRREHATLRALGATSAQLGQTVIAHAVSLAAIGALAGVPLGVALGRTVFLAVADGLGALGQAAVPGPTIGLVVTGAVLASMLLATVPARRVASRGLVAALQPE